MKQPEKSELLELAKRFELVLAQKGWSARSWAERAGLSSPGHVSTIIANAKKGKSKDVSFAVFRALADVADVPVDWLATGRGDIAQHANRHVDNSDPYPSRKLVIAAARVALFPDEAIEMVRSIDSYADDPGRGVWFDELRAAESRVLAQRSSKIK